MHRSTLSNPVSSWTSTKEHENKNEESKSSKRNIAKYSVTETKTSKLVANGKIVCDTTWEQAKLFIRRVHVTNLRSIASVLQECFQESTVANRGNALTAHMHRSTLSNPMSSWTYQAPHLLVIGCDFAKHVPKAHACMHLHNRQVRCSESWTGNHHRQILDTLQQDHNVPCVQNHDCTAA